MIETSKNAIYMMVRIYTPKANKLNSKFLSSYRQSRYFSLFENQLNNASFSNAAVSDGFLNRSLRRDLTTPYFSLSLKFYFLPGLSVTYDIINIKNGRQSVLRAASKVGFCSKISNLVSPELTSE